MIVVMDPSLRPVREKTLEHRDVLCLRMYVFFVHKYLKGFI